MPITFAAGTPLYYAEISIASPDLISEARPALTAAHSGLGDCSLFSLSVPYLAVAPDLTRFLGEFRVLSTPTNAILNLGS